MAKGGTRGWIMKDEVGEVLFVGFQCGKTSADDLILFLCIELKEFDYFAVLF